MTKKEKKATEQELRRKIQDKLKQEFQRQKSKQTDSEQHEPQLIDRNVDRSALDREMVRKALYEEICSRYPEFIKCENHLNETAWLTPLELEQNFEFYAVEEGWFTRLKEGLFGRPAPAELKDKRLKDLAEEMRPEIEADVKKRLEYYRQKQKEFAEHLTDELERKIYEEEMDRFYRNKRGYHKYRNYLGETKWMTKEEFLNQDEFTEEVLTPRQIILRWAGAAVLVLLIFFGAWKLFDYLSGPKENKAYLIVQLKDVRVAPLYIDKNLAIGFSANVPYLITPGEHEVTVIRDGYETLPKTQKINASAGDTVRIGFRFEKKKLINTGLVVVDAPRRDAAVLFDGEFYGTLTDKSRFTLPAGAHTVTIEKAGYVSSPPQHVFNLRPGDTLKVAFKLSARKKAARAKAGSVLNTGLVEVRSNVKNAQIYLDGQLTEFETDYVLQRIPFGKHIIRVAKKGYKVYPKERTIEISSRNKRAVADFTLTNLFKSVTLETRPVAAQIFIDDKPVGISPVRLSLPLGKHRIAFSDVPHYIKPDVGSVEITENGPTQFTFHYDLAFSVNFSLSGIQPDNGRNSYLTGYLPNGDHFVQSATVGPESKWIKTLGEKVWDLGFAFQYRNPPGQDALMFQFYIPGNVDLSQQIKLKIYAYRSDENYPLVIKGSSYYRIDINNFRFRKQVRPLYRQDEISEDHYDSFTINEFLHPGNNKIMIATTKKTSARVILWKVVIE